MAARQSNLNQLMNLILKDFSLYKDNSLINIPDNTIIDKPIIIINNSKTNIIMGKNSKALIIAAYLSQIEANVNITINDNACLSYIALQETTKHKTQALNIKASQQAKSTFNMHAINFGGKLSKLITNIFLLGESTICNLYSLKHAKDQEQYYADFNLEHKYPNSTSKIVIKGILEDQSHDDFTGKIIVNPHASFSQADLQHKSLLLSKHAKVNSKPQLEVYNDNGKFSHSSATEQLDEDALFYMNTRGISMTQAKKLFIEGFIAPIIETIPLATIKQPLADLLV